jgi:hypothetical protein
MLSINDLLRNEKADANQDVNSDQVPDIKKDTYDPTTKYKNILNTQQTDTESSDYKSIDDLLEKEKQHNKTEIWIKLDKTIKILIN